MREHALTIAQEGIRLNQLNKEVQEARAETKRLEEDLVRKVDLFEKQSEKVMQSALKLKEAKTQRDAEDEEVCSLLENFLAELEKLPDE